MDRGEDRTRTTIVFCTYCRKTTRAWKFGPAREWQCRDCGKELREAGPKTKTREGRNSS